jgi:hypothetical protein
MISLRTSRPADIYYTLDETKPDPKYSLFYREPIALWSSTTLRFLAIDTDGRIGPEGRESYRIDALFPLTWSMPRPGNYREPIEVTLQSDKPADIFYTLDGQQPTIQSERYHRPLLITRDTTILFFGLDAAGNREPVQRSHYNFPPQISLYPAAGVYAQKPLRVVIRTDEPANIEYAFAHIPFAKWETYREPLELQRDTRLRIRAEDAQGFLSDIENHDYTFIQPLNSSLLPQLQLSPLAVAAVDLEGFDNFGLIIATQRELYISKAHNGILEPPELAAKLPFVTSWVRSWDIDGDGLNDVLLGDTRGGVHLLRSLPGGRLLPDTQILADLRSQSIQSVIPVDYDSDGQLDLFVLDLREAESRLYRRVQNSYIPQNPIQPPIMAGSVAALAADFDKNGKPDLLILPSGPNSPYILYGNGHGGFVRHTLQPFLDEYSYGVTWLHAAYADFDADGDLDLLLVGRVPPELNSPAQIVLLILLHLDGPYWKATDPLLLPDSNLRGILIADLDGDGLPDAVLLRHRQAPIPLFNFLGLRLFPAPSSLLPAPLPASLAATVTHLKPIGTHQLLLFPSGQDPLILHTPLKPPYLSLLIRGIQGNRNAIGCRILIQTSTGSILREIGIPSTAPDQAPLLMPIPLDNDFDIRSLLVRWSDGQTREIPNPALNQTSIIQPN